MSRKRRKPSPTSSSRRNFLKGLGAATIAGTVPFAALRATAANLPDLARDPKALAVKHRRITAFNKKLRAAASDRKVPVPKHPGNGDEARYPTGIGNYTKGLPHDQYGEVDQRAYVAYLAAVRTGKRVDFDNIPLGGTTPLVDPQAGLAFDLEGIDVSQNSIPPFDALASPGLGSQLIEVYWQALARDVPFSQYATTSLTRSASTELTGLPGFAGPRAGGAATPQTLFRGFPAGDVIGPYVSQFFVQPFTYGVIPFTGCMTVLPGDFMVDTVSWLKVQNGQRPFASERPDPTLRFIRNGRDLAEYVHNDVLFQEYLNAALMLATMHAPLNSANPYGSLKSETGFITFGFPMVQVLVAEVIARALKHAWFQKWFIHRALRPEETGGLVHFSVTGAKSYPLDASVFNSSVIQQAFNQNGTYLLPHSYPEGCPQHPSYPSGHATAAGAAVTILKWFFDETFVIPQPLVATDDGSAVVPYTGADASQLTVGGEIDKLASNVGFGRVFAGIHWRRDIEEGMRLGETVAIAMLKDQAHLYSESFSGFTFTKFDGSKITI